MYRGIGFTRVLLCVRDASTNSLKGRFGFGANVDEIIRKGFAIPISGSRDVFQAAIATGADILIEDADELALLKTLRNQAVLAVRQHSS